MPEDLDLSRREFLQVGTASAAALSGSGLQVTPEEPDNPVDSSEYQSVAHLLGPEQARPEPGSGFFANKDYYGYLYEVNDPPSAAGTTFYITQNDADWQILNEAMPQTQVDETRVEDYTSFFNHTFARPSAPDTKNWQFTSADITKQDSELELASTTVLQTTQRGNYPAGTEAIPGSAWRTTSTPSSGRADVGYFDANNGFGVGEDATGSYVFLRKAGSEYKVYRTDEGNGGWNGYDPGERVWTDSDPVVTRFPHLFYGGGNIRVRVLRHSDGQTRLRTLHTFTPNNVNTGDGPPFDQPNLPIRFETSSLSGASLRANAAHYEFGEENAENRVNGEHFNDVSVGTSGWTPLISWEKRTGWGMTNVKPLKIAVAATTNDVKVELQLGSTVDTTSDNWRLPTHTSSSETAVQVDTDSSLTSNGERRWVGHAFEGQGNSAGAAEENKLDFNLPSDRTVTLAAQAVGGSATASGTVSWEEYF